MERREMIKRMSWYMGGVISTPTILAILNSCTPTEKSGKLLTSFNGKHTATLNELTETILPATDTPGAKDVGVPKFIEDIVSNVYSEEDRLEFLNNFKFLDARAQKEFGEDFIDLDQARQLEFATRINTEMVRALNDPETHPEKELALFRTVKELTLFGFFTSEAGATQVLKYDKIPVHYDGCVPFDEIGRAWAT